MMLFRFSSAFLDQALNGPDSSSPSCGMWGCLTAGKGVDARACIQFYESMCCISDEVMKTKKFLLLLVGPLPPSVNCFVLTRHQDQLTLTI